MPYGNSTNKNPKRRRKSGGLSDTPGGSTRGGLSPTPNLPGPAPRDLPRLPGGLTQTPNIPHSEAARQPSRSAPSSRPAAAPVPVVVVPERGQPVVVPPGGDVRQAARQAFGGGGTQSNAGEGFVSGNRSHRDEARRRMRQSLKAAQQAEAMQLAKARQTQQLAVATDPVSVPNGQVAGTDTMRKVMTVAGHQGLDNDVAVPLAVRRNASGNERAGQDFRSVAIGGREFHMYGDGTIVKANARNPQQQATEFMQSARRTTDEDATGQAHTTVEGQTGNAPIRQAGDEEMRRRVLERWVEENDPALTRVKNRSLGDRDVQSYGSVPGQTGGMAGVVAGAEIGYQDFRRWAKKHPKAARRAHRRAERG